MHGKHNNLDCYKKKDKELDHYIGRAVRNSLGLSQGPQFNLAVIAYVFVYGVWFVAKRKHMVPLPHKMKNGCAPLQALIHVGTHGLVRETFAATG